MVIQSNMSAEAIVEIWEATADVFKRNNILITQEPLETFVVSERLKLILQELNSVVGSSSKTCVSGG